MHCPVTCVASLIQRAEFPSERKCLIKEKTLQETKAMCLSERWSLIQKLRQNSWDRWSKEYLHQLQPCSKWWKSKPSLKIGDLILIFT